LFPKAPQNFFLRELTAKYILRFKKSINKDKIGTMNKLDAYKMDGLGNDFIIFDKRKKSISLTKDEIIKISDRKNIGCDQVIFINNDKKHDAYLTFFNSDGGEIAACGNGSRCVADLLIRENKKKKISLKTKAGILEAELSNNNLIRVNMGQPNFNWKEIPLSKEMNNENLKIKINSNDGKEVEGGFALSVGNPHIIFFVNDYENYNIKILGQK
jgi:diaminopimelate epimerase